MKINEILEKYKDKEFKDDIIELLDKYIIVDEEFKVGDLYCYVNEDGRAGNAIFHNTTADKYRMDYRFGSRMMEECIFKHEQAKMLFEYKTYCEKYSDKLDWEDNNQIKFSVYFIKGLNVIGFRETALNRNQGSIYATSKQIHKDFINKVGEEDFKKYILGV